MSDQLSFPGIEAEKKPTDRLFFGIFPEVAEAEEIKGVAHDQRAQH